MTARPVIIIPARYQSSRFPGKPLAEIDGRPLIEHVYRSASQAHGFGETIVATDDKRIEKAVLAFGGNVLMTSADHRTGTDRIAEVAAGVTAPIVVNLQVDELFISPRAIEAVLEPLKVRPGEVMATLMTRINSTNELDDPNVVKVVVDQNGHALYFSRAPIPLARDGQAAVVYRHIGLYAYRHEFLLKLAELEQTPLEKAESLEQLRALENGYKISVVEVEQESIAIDTPEQLARVNGQGKE
ncbi:MAG TPA: 3-deoxy-manno-octulosonate cytidylyltransferase [Myxococcota bacterium]|nr:3-deoxy-manno-octulosonate cytidylyltransferase [Myxococcota bacterium]